jgi:hypothetical protein
MKGSYLFKLYTPYIDSYRHPGSLSLPEKLWKSICDRRFSGHLLECSLYYSKQPYSLDFYSTLLHLPPCRSDATVSETAGIEPRAVAT